MDFRNKVKPTALTATLSTLLLLFNMGCSKDNAKGKLKSGLEKKVEQTSNEKAERENTFNVVDGFDGQRIIKTKFDGRLFKGADIMLLDISGKSVGFTQLSKDKAGNLVGDIYFEGTLREAEGRRLVLLSEMFTGEKEYDMGAVYGKEIILDGEDVELREMNKDVIRYYEEKYRGN